MDEDQLPLLRQLQRVGARLLQRVAVQHHLGARPRVRSTFTMGNGMTITAWIPRRCAR